MNKEQFPQNIRRSGPSLTLGDYYKITLGRLGYAQADVPDFLFYTFAGDLLGSSGEHYEKGNPIQFYQAVNRASHAFSDDFMESLAMALMRDRPYETDGAALMEARDDFFAHLKSHFEQFSLTYSPWFKPLFEADTVEDYLAITAQHASCGAAMRAGVMGAMGMSETRALPLFLLSHAHVEAIEGAYLVYGFVKAAMQTPGITFDGALEEGYRTAEWGRSEALAFLRAHGLEEDQVTCPQMRGHCASVFLKKDAYATISDIAEEGIETRFVVPAALYVTARAAAFEDEEQAVKSLVERGLKIGGDPDTICSIAMGMLGALRPGIKSVLADIVLPQDPHEMNKT